MSMADRASSRRRSISFELLAINSPGDGEFLESHGQATNSIPGDDRPDKPLKRKRRKSKNRKAHSDPNIGALIDENLGAIEEMHSGCSGSPLNDMTPLKDLIHPRADGALADLRLQSMPLNTDLLRDVHLESLTKEAIQSPETKRTFSLKSLATDDDAPAALQSGQKSSPSTESLRNLATGLPSPASFAFATKSPDSGKSSPVASRIGRGVETSENSRVLVPSPDTTLEAAASRGASMSPKDGFSGRASPATSGTHGLPNYTSLGGGQREPPVFAPGSPRPFTELRQRAVERASDSPVQENGVDAGGKVTLSKVVSFRKQQRAVETDPSYLGRVDVIESPSPLARLPLASYETPHLTEWERLMDANSEYPATVDLSPINYLRGEVQRGSSFERHSSAGIQQKRERIYNTMFHVPWRCELLIDVGFFVCLDSFLSLFTVMPARILMFLWQRLLHWRQFQRPYAAELSDFGSLIILVLGVAVLQQADISFIYHYIRGQATIKLYVVFNVLEIFDKLCQSFGGDVLQVLLNSAVAIGECPPDRLIKQWAQFCLDQSIAIVSFLLHSLVIMSQAITVSAAINSQNNALLTLLISNNFAEIKSNVFKRVAKENLHKMAYHDTVERFHIMAHLLFVLAQNIQNSEDSWLWNFAYNAGMVLLCEVLVDVIKHAFLAKFNEIKPGAYSEFLQALCKQTLNSQSHEVHKTLHFVPLAPACVVLRVLIPLYATFLPQGPFWHRFAGILMLGGGTFIILLAMKIFVGLGLQMHAAWYLKRCKHKEGHPHAD